MIGHVESMHIVCDPKQTLTKLHVEFILQDELK